MIGQYVVIFRSCGTIPEAQSTHDGEAHGMGVSAFWFTFGFVFLELDHFNGSAERKRRGGFARSIWS